MNKRNQRIAAFYSRMQSYGISMNDADALRRIEMTLQRWGERECNGEVERDEKSGKTYSAFYGGMMTDAHKRYPVADKESGALRRAEGIMTKYPHLWFYHQQDPRGCALYIGRKSDLKKDEELDCYYSSRGAAVCY